MPLARHDTMHYKITMKSSWLAIALLCFSAQARASEISGFETTPPTDQGLTLQCWAVSSTARLDFAASRQAGHLLKLSPKYTVYSKTRDEVVRFILSWGQAGKFPQYDGALCETCETEKIYYEQGGIYADAVEAAKAYGVIPEAAYSGFPHKDERLFRRLNELIAWYDHHARHFDFRSAQLREQVEHDVTEILDHFLGRPPGHFDFEGKTFTPKSFFREYLPGWEQAGALELNYDPAAATEGEIVVPAYDDIPYIGYLTRHAERIVRVIDESLKAGEPVLVQYKVIDEDHTQQLGSIGFASHGLAPQTPATLAWNDAAVLDHYVLAVGAQWSASGTLERILIKNTWGLSVRENGGYHWIEPDYFPWLEAVEISPAMVPRLRALSLIP
jgi:hypothetical protein